MYYNIYFIYYIIFIYIYYVVFKPFLFPPGALGVKIW